MSLVDELIKEWKSIIESLEVDGYRRIVRSTDLILMGNEPKLCYKVNFNFALGDSDNECVVDNVNDLNLYSKWNLELDKIFCNLFTESKIFNKGISSGEWSFKNSKVDYFQNQGYRIIIQFYPQGFISQLRNKNLELLGI